VRRNKYKSSAAFLPWLSPLTNRAVRGGHDGCGGIYGSHWSPSVWNDYIFNRKQHNSPPREDKTALCGKVGSRCPSPMVESSDEQSSAGRPWRMRRRMWVPLVAILITYVGWLHLSPPMDRGHEGEAAVGGPLQSRRRSWSRVRRSPNECWCFNSWNI
jgi:hypothetical protein